MNTFSREGFDLNTSRTKCESMLATPICSVEELRYVYIGVLISLCPFLFPVFLSAAQSKEFFGGWIKEIRTKKS
jgi:hypothetical protein